MRYKCDKSCEEYSICDKRHVGRWCPDSEDEEPTSLPGLTPDEFREFTTLGHTKLGKITQEQHDRYMFLVKKTIQGMSDLLEENDEKSQDC